jgi:serine/threonine-protein kinase
MKTADARALNNLIGVRIGKFDVIAEIGTGGMATVYLARSVGGGGFHRLVAIKVMHRHLSSEDGFVEMFLDEARVAATIHHPNIVSILDVGLEDGLIFLVMDYVEGDSFSAIEKIAVNQRKRIPLNVILRVALDSLAGLHAAHELCDIHGQHLKIIHRDVSPHNIVTGVDGISRIVDFGIAKAETRITTTKVGMIKGKLNFMAPEQIRNTPLDRRVDIFGMGVTLWEAVTLRRLYAGENDFDTARKILAGEYPPLTQFDPTLPPALDEICRKALHPNPDERFRTAEEFAVAIERNLRDYIAPHREVGAFIATVAAPKIERERRALRESIAGPPACRRRMRVSGQALAR